MNRRDAFFLLNTLLDAINGVGRFDVNLDFFASESLDLDHGATPKPQDQVKSGLFLDVVVSQGAAVFKLFTGEDQPLLIRRDP